MDRNEPCPCGSGKKYKKCHGAAVPPEAAALPAAQRAELLRATTILQRDKRITQEIVDWADRRFGPEFMDNAMTAWGVPAEEELPEEEGDLFTMWALHHYVATPGQLPAAAQWLDAQQARLGARMDADVVSLVQAQGAATMGFWQVETIEPGVGTTIYDRLGDRTLFVHENAITHDLEAELLLLAYVMEVDGLHLFAGLHDHPLPLLEGKEVIAAAYEAGGVSAPPIPADITSTADGQQQLGRLWFDAIERLYDRLEAEDAEQAPDEQDDSPPS
jgi:SEC-C motif